MVQEVPKFVENVNQAVMQDKKQVPNLSATVSAVVIILNNIADASTAVNETIMQVRKPRGLSVFLLFLTNLIKRQKPTKEVHSV